MECRVDGAHLVPGNRSAYVGTAAIEDIDTAKHIYLIGTDPTVEAPVLNARIRKSWLNGATVTHVGANVDLGFDIAHLGSDTQALVRLLADAKPQDDAIVILGQGGLVGDNGAGVQTHAMALTEKLGAGLLVLHTAAGRVGAMDAGCTTDGGIEAALNGAEVVYNLGADEMDIAPGPFVIYQGSHGDRGAHRAAVILPAAAYPEEQGLFVNTEGRPQLALRAGHPPGEAKENWAILRALSGEMGAALPYDSLAQLRQALVAEAPHLAQIDEVPENTWTPVDLVDLGDGQMQHAVQDFYLTNPVARASALMAELSANAKARRAPPVAAE